jgi:hypothetical protein
MSSGAPALPVVQSSAEATVRSLTARLATVEAHIWALAAVAAALDVLLTYRGLQLGLTEGNPVVSALLGSAGIAGLVAVKLVVIGLAALGRYVRPRWGPWLSLGMVVPWLAAAGINATWLAVL